MYDDILNKELLRKPKITSWISGPAIILCWFLFWPLGIYLTYKRARIDKKAAIIISIIVIILGAIFFLGGLRFLSGGLIGDDIANMNALIIMGIILISIGIYTRKSAKRFLNYLDLVVDQGYSSIDSVAASMSTNYDVAKRDLQKLIGDGYLNGSYIDESAREIVFPMNKSITYKITVNDSLDNNEPKAVACKSCGAINKVIAGTVGECEFCGSPISV